MKNITGNRIHLTPLLVLVILLGCGKSILSIVEYEKWIRNPVNGLVKERVVSQVKYKLTFQPTDWLLAKATRLNYTNLEVDKIKGDYSNVLSFTMDITSENEEVSMLKLNLDNQSEYYTRLNYYSNLFQQDVYVVEGFDTLPCRFAHMEQSYNASPFNTITIEFLRTTKEVEYQDIYLVYYDRIFNTGLIKFHFKGGDLNDIPDLKL